MAGLSYSDLVTQIRNYTETDSNVLTTAILENIILNSQYRIMRDIPIDADRLQQEGNLVTGQESINAPAGALFIRGIQVYDSTSSIAGANTYLEKKDVTFLEEYISATTSTGTPKYYAMLDTGATGESSSNSGSIIVSPTPSDTFGYKIHYNAAPATLESGNVTNYISMNFPNGLLYAALVETYGYLKGPADMLQLYEQKYKEEAQKFALEQTGRRRRDDYTDGTIRTKIDSASP